MRFRRPSVKLPNVRNDEYTKTTERSTMTFSKDDSRGFCFLPTDIPVQIPPWPKVSQSETQGCYEAVTANNRVKKSELFKKQASIFCRDTHCLTPKIVCNIGLGHRENKEWYPYFSIWQVNEK